MTITGYQQTVLDAVAAGRVTFTCGPGAGRADYVLDRDQVRRTDVTPTIRKLQRAGLVAHVPARYALDGVSGYVLHLVEPEPAAQLTAHHCDFPAACHFSARVCSERNPAPTVWDTPTSTYLRT